MLLVAEGVTGCGVLHADGSRDVTRVAGVNIRPVVRVHHQDTTQTLALALGRVVHDVAGMYHTGVNAEVAQLSDERVGHNLERQRRERLIVVRLAGILLAGLGIDAVHGRDIHRRGHIVNDRIQHLLDALIAVGRTAADRHDLVGDGRLTQRGTDILLGEGSLLQVLLHQRLVGLGGSLNHLIVILLRQLLHVVRDRLDTHILTLDVIVNVGFHLHQVNDATEGHLLADGELNRNGMRMQTVAHHIQHAIEIRAGDVHLVDVCHSRHMILVRLALDGLGLGFNAALGAEDGHRTVQHAQGTLDLDGEVHVYGGIDDVDAMTLPVAGGSGRGNGDTSFLLLLHPVHRSCALMGLAQLMGLSGIEQDTLGCRGLTGINVRHNADIPGIFKRIFPRH